MEGDNSISESFSSQNLDETVQNTTLLDDGPRICPVCSTIIRLYFVNFNEQILMCENMECTYPLGYKKVQFYKVDPDLDPDSENITLRGGGGIGGLSSISKISAVTWPAIGKSKPTFDEESQCSFGSDFSLNILMPKEKLLKYKEKQQKKKEELEILKNIRDIEGINTELRRTQDNYNRTLQNKQWIRHLRNLQKFSGIKLVKEKELDILKEEKLQVKVDIDTNPQCGSIINIKIDNTD